MSGHVLNRRTQIKRGLKWGTGHFLKKKQVPFGKLRAGSPLHSYFASRSNCSGRDDKFFWTDSAMPLMTVVF